MSLHFRSDSMGSSKGKSGVQYQNLSIVPLGPPPTDVANLAYIIYFALGAGLLLPWNAFITAIDYFGFLYPNSHIDRVFSMAYTLSGLTVLVFLTVSGRHYSSWSRINLGVSVFLFNIALVPILDNVFLKGDRGSTATCVITVAAVGSTGVADALVQGSLIGSAGHLPNRYMQSVISGTAASGVLVSFLRLITKASIPQTPDGLRMSANIYFSVSIAFLIVCLVSFNAVHKLPVMRYYNEMRFASVESALLPVDEEKTSGGFGFRKGQSGQVVAETSLGKSADQVSYCKVFGHIKWYCLALMLIYVVTLSIYPGYLAEDVHSAWLGDWYPVLLITAYNVFDLVGKCLTAFVAFERKSYIIGGCWARLLLYPLFAVSLHGPHVFRTEFPVFLLTSVLGVTNGFFTSNLMTVASKSVKVQESETAGIILVLFLVLGLTSGSLLSWAWVI